MSNKFRILFSTNYSPPISSVVAIFSILSQSSHFYLKMHATFNIKFSARRVHAITKDDRIDIYGWNVKLLSISKITMGT